MPSINLHKMTVAEYLESIKNRFPEHTFIELISVPTDISELQYPADLFKVSKIIGYCIQPVLGLESALYVALVEKIDIIDIEDFNKFWAKYVINLKDIQKENLILVGLDIPVKVEIREDITFDPELIEKIKLNFQAYKNELNVKRMFHGVIR